jgi:hypothetical protein
VNQIRKWLPDVGLANVRLHATGVAPDYADAMFNLALLLQRTNQYAEAADYWRRYLDRWSIGMGCTGAPITEILRDADTI